MIIINEFPKNLHNETSKIEHLIETSKNKKERVLGVIDRVGINVWPNSTTRDILMVIAREKMSRSISHKRY